MAVTENTYTGDGSTVLFSFTFPYLDQSHVKVSLNGSDTTAFTFANATTVQLNSAPGVGVAVRVYRNSDEDNVEATFFPGSTIRSEDLNDNFLQSLYLNQETRRIAQDATTGAIPDGSISSAKLGSEVVTEPKIGPAAVTESKIGTGAVTESKLGAASVTNSKIAAGAVQATQIGTDAITNPKIATGAVNTDELANSAVTVDKLANSAVTTDKLANSAVTQDKIGSNVLTPTVSTINSGPLAGLRNAFLNGDFAVWQRGASFVDPATASFIADRWQVSWNGTGATRTISRQTHTLGQIDVPGNPLYFLRWAQTIAGSGATTNALVHNIEGVRTFAGTQVTLSFYAKAATNITLPTVVVSQVFGTGGSPSTNVNTTVASNVAITTSWQRFSYTFTMPSISGKTLGTDDNDKIVTTINLPLNSAFTFDISDVQLELGSVATPYERLPLGFQRDVLCARYYQTRLVRVNTATSPPAQVTFSPRMRATPVITGGGAGLVLYAGSDRGFGATQTSANDETFIMIAEV